MSARVLQRHHLAAERAAEQKAAAGHLSADGQRQLVDVENVARDVGAVVVVAAHLWKRGESEESVGKQDTDLDFPRGQS
jgi:hypothetical protein